MHHVLDQHSPGVPSLRSSASTPGSRSQSAFEQNACSFADDVLDRCARRETSGVSPRLACARIALLGGEDGGTQARRLNAPALLPSEHVHRIARGKAGERRQAPIDQASQRLDPLAGAGELAEPPRRARSSASQTRCSSRSRCAPGSRPALRKANCAAYKSAGAPRGASLPQIGQHRGKLFARANSAASLSAGRSKAAVHGQSAPRCRHRDRRCARQWPRPSSASPRSPRLRRAPGSATDDDRNIGRCAAHVGDRKVLKAAQETCAHDARRRPREDGLDRVLEGDLGPASRSRHL